MEVKADVGGEPMDVACKCGAAFCFQCTEEAHRPVSWRTLPGCLFQLPECPQLMLQSTLRRALHAKAMMVLAMLPGCHGVR